MKKSLLPFPKYKLNCNCKHHKFSIMISIFKNFYQKPQILASDKTKALVKQILETQDSQEVANLIQRIAGRFYKDEGLKNVLNELYSHKCAFCEQKTDTIIEDFRPRPKSLYPWLALEWSNLIHVCRECSYSKSDKFLIKGKKALLNSFPENEEVLFANSVLLQKEQALLIHPEIDSPENHITFNKNGLAIGRTEKGRYTIETCNLNRELLVNKRQEIIDTLRSDVKKSIKNEIDLIGFVAKLYDLQQSKNEFSRLYQVIWEDISFLLSYDEETLEEYTDISVILRNKQNIFLLNKKQLLNEKISKRCLYSFQIQNLEGVRYISIDALPTSAKWIFLTGENGYGKTTILKGIAAGLVGKDTISDEARIKIQLLSSTESNKVEINEYIWQSDSHIPFSNIAVYGANRTTLSKNQTKPNTEKPQEALNNLWNENVELLNIERYLTDIYYRENLRPKYEAIIATLKRVIPQLAKIEIDDSKDIPEVKYFEYTDDKETHFQEVSFEQLATGIKSIIAMVGDMLCRFMIDKTITSTEDIQGFVLIDELDIHLHPKWQKRLPMLLSEAFPNVQFIASTHSPIPLLGAPEGSVFLTVNRNKEEGITVERLVHLEQERSKLTANLLLDSAIFGHAEVFDATHKKGEKIYPENTFAEIVETQKLSEKLQETLPSEKQALLLNLLNKYK
jgi:uncharacterized protein (TIGR02646 family)